MDAGTGDSTSFARALQALKRAGCAILVVDNGSDDARVCRELLGGSEPARRRLVVATTRTAADRHRSVDRSATVLEASVDDTRSAGESVPDPANTPASGGPMTDDKPAVPGDDVDALADRVADEIDRIENRAPGNLDPAELRICVDALDPLLVRNDPEAVRRFVATTADRIRTNRGMGHFHLRTDDLEGTPFAPSLDPFDIRLDVRQQPGGARNQRWLLREAGIDTGWIRMGQR